MYIIHTHIEVTIMINEREAWILEGGGWEDLEERGKGEMM